MPSIQRISFIAAVMLTVPFTYGDARAQDTTHQRGVRIGLTYQPGTRPGVVVLPVSGPAGDSVRAMLERDLDFSDRVQVIGREGTSAHSTAEQAGSGAVNYALWKRLGAAGVVRGAITGSGLNLELHDVSTSRVTFQRAFPLPASGGSDEWRLAVHGVADELVRQITGTRGAAQTRLLYVKGGRVYVIDSDGHGERALTDGGSALSPTWHPSGRHIAFSQFGPRGTQIMIRDLAANRSSPLTATPGGLNITPEFSPDGRQLVYAHGLESGTDLYVADPFGSGGARRITVGRGTDNVSPSYSPDGRRIAFTSGRAGHPEVYTMDADGSNVELLTPFNFGDQSYRSNPAWSPDGRLIAFQSQIAGRFQIMTINLRDRSIKQHTSEGVNEDPSWSPDGRHLVFTSDRTGTKQLWVLDVESGRARQLTRSGGARLAAWSRVLDSTQ
jgi:TolB protein